MSNPLGIYLEQEICRGIGCNNIIVHGGWNSPKKYCRMCIGIKQRDTAKRKQIINNARWMTQAQKKKIPEIEEICNG